MTTGADRIVTARSLNRQAAAATLLFVQADGGELVRYPRTEAEARLVADVMTALWEGRTVRLTEVPSGR